MKTETPLNLRSIRKQKYVTPPEAAALIDRDINEIYRWIQNDLIRYSKAGARYTLPRIDVLAMHSDLLARHVHPDGLKKCKGCRQMKEAYIQSNAPGTPYHPAQFSRHSGNYDGLQHVCKECQKKGVRSTDIRHKHKGRDVSSNIQEAFIFADEAEHRAAIKLLEETAEAETIEQVVKIRGRIAKFLHSLSA